MKNKKTSSKKKKSKEELFLEELSLEALNNILTVSLDCHNSQVLIALNSQTEFYEREFRYSLGGILEPPDFYRYCGAAAYGMFELQKKIVVVSEKTATQFLDLYNKKGELYSELDKFLEENPCFKSISKTIGSLFVPDYEKISELDDLADDAIKVVYGLLETQKGKKGRLTDFFFIPQKP